MVPAIRYRFTPTLSSYETRWVPTYKMEQAARVQDVEQEEQREPLCDEDEEDDEPEAKRLRLY